MNLWVLLFALYPLFFAIFFFTLITAGDEKPGRASAWSIMLSLAADLVVLIGWLISKGLIASFQ